MDDSQLQNLEDRTYNKYEAADDKWADPFAELDALKVREARGSDGDIDSSTETESKAKRERKAKVRSKKFKSLKKAVDRAKYFKSQDAVETVLGLSKERFDSSVELNIELKKDTLNGEISLPHGTGKQIRVEIFSDKTIEKIEKKQLDFEVLLAKPDDMAKIAKYARILGPKGLMPNPKNGSVTPDPESKAKELTSGGKISFKSEKKAPLIHLMIGKRSQGIEKVQENLNAVFKTINPRQIKKAYLSSSMGPGLRLDLNSFDASLTK